MSKEILDHKCIICGTAYHACDTCQHITTYTPWRTLCDTFEHYQIYLIIREWQEKWLTNEEAKEKLEKLGISNRYNFKNWPDGTKKILNTIFETKKKQPKNVIQDENLDVVEE